MTETRPEPVLNAATIAGAVAALVIAIGGLLRLVGVLDLVDAELEELAKRASDAVLGIAVLWATLGPALLAWHARAKVTPLEAPRDAAGRELVAVDELEVLGELAVADGAAPDTLELPALVRVVVPPATGRHRLTT